MGVPRWARAAIKGPTRPPPPTATSDPRPDQVRTLKRTGDAFAPIRTDQTFRRSKGKKERNGFNKYVRSLKAFWLFPSSVIFAFPKALRGRNGGTAWTGTGPAWRRPNSTSAARARARPPPPTTPHTFTTGSTATATSGTTCMPPGDASTNGPRTPRSAGRACLQVGACGPPRKGPRGGDFGALGRTPVFE